MMLNALRSRLRGLHVHPAICALVPAIFEGFSPPRGHGPARTEILRSGGIILMEESGETIPSPNPLRQGGQSETDLSRLASVSPDNLVFELRNASLRGSDGHIVTSKDRLVFDAGFWGRLRPRPDRDHSLYQLRKRKPRQRLTGLVVSLASDFAFHGYGHFIHDSLPRLRLLQLAGVKLADADWIYLPRLNTPATREITAALGLTKSRVLNYDPSCDLECEQLIATTYPHAVGSIAPREAKFLSDLGGYWRKPDAPRRRVFLSRSGYARNFRNENEIHDILRRFEFEIIDPANDGHSLAACAQALIIVGIDGANMANLAFSPCDTRVLLIYPESPPPLPYMMTLAYSAGRTVHVLAASPSGQPPRPYVENFVIDSTVFESALARICFDPASQQS